MTPSKRIEPRSTVDFSASASPAAIALGIALAIAPTWARAEIQVRGTPQAVVVEVQNATVEEVLVALTDTFNVQLRSAADLDKRLTGTYEGTLQQAVSHILKGYDFVVKSDQSGLEITLLGAGKPKAVVGARPATKLAEAAPAAAPTPTATADDADHPVLVPSSGGPTPPVEVAQGPFRRRGPPVLLPVPCRRSGSRSGPVPCRRSGRRPGPVPCPHRCRSNRTRHRPYQRPRRQLRHPRCRPPPRRLHRRRSLHPKRAFNGPKLHDALGMSAKQFDDFYRENFIKPYIVKGKGSLPPPTGAKCRVVGSN
jgi:hypothetical protein